MKAALQVEVDRIARALGRRSVAGVLAAAAGAVGPNEEEEQRRSRISRPLISIRRLSIQFERSRRIERILSLFINTHHYDHMAVLYDMDHIAIMVSFLTFGRVLLLSAYTLSPGWEANTIEVSSINLSTRNPTSWLTIVFLRNLPHTGSS